MSLNLQLPSDTFFIGNDTKPRLWHCHQAWNNQIAYLIFKVNILISI